MLFRSTELLNDNSEGITFEITNYTAEVIDPSTNAVTKGTAVAKGSDGWGYEVKLTHVYEVKVDGQKYGYVEGAVTEFTGVPEGNYILAKTGAYKGNAAQFSADSSGKLTVVNGFVATYGSNCIAWDSTAGAWNDVSLSTAYSLTFADSATVGNGYSAVVTPGSEASVTPVTVAASDITSSNNKYWVSAGSIVSVKATGLAAANATDTLYFLLLVDDEQDTDTITAVYGTNPAESKALVIDGIGDDTEIDITKGYKVVVDGVDAGVYSGNSATIEAEGADGWFVPYSTESTGVAPIVIDGGAWSKDELSFAKGIATGVNVNTMATSYAIDGVITLLPAAKITVPTGMTVAASYGDLKDVTITGSGEAIDNSANAGTGYVALGTTLVVMKTGSALDSLKVTFQPINETAAAEENFFVQGVNGEAVLELEEAGAYNLAEMTAIPKITLIADTTVTGSAKWASNNATDLTSDTGIASSVLNSVSRTYFDETGKAVTKTGKTLAEVGTVAKDNVMSFTFTLAAATGATNYFFPADVVAVAGKNITVTVDSVKADGSAVTITVTFTVTADAATKP